MTGGPLAGVEPVDSDERQERRVGVLAPSSNTVVEMDIHAAMPAHVRVQTARMHLEHTGVVAERAMLEEHLPGAVHDLATCHPDVVAFACTSASALLGPDGEDAMIRDLARETGATVVSTSWAVAAELVPYDGQPVAVLTAYADELNDAVAASLSARGVTVSHVAGMGITDNFAIGLVPPPAIVAFATSQPEVREAAALFVSCTNLRALEARRDLEHVLGIPVVTSNSATIAATIGALQGPRTDDHETTGATHADHA